MKKNRTLLSRAVRIACFCCLIASLGLMGCIPAEKPFVWQDQEASFADYAVFEILPAFNASGQPVDPDITEVLTEHLKEQFSAKRLPLQEPTIDRDGVLIVKSEVIDFQGSRNTSITTRDGVYIQSEARCTVRAKLLNKANNIPVAVVVTTKVGITTGAHSVAFGSGTISSTHNHILKEAATTIAEEVAKLMLRE